MPPSWDHRRTTPLEPARVGVVRAVWVVLLVVGGYAAVRGWSWGFGWLAMLLLTVALTPPPQRRQVLGLPPRS